MIPLVRGEMIKVRTTRTALGFGVASVLLVLAVVLITILAGDPGRRARTKKDALNLGGGALHPAAAVRHRRRDRRVPPPHARARRADRARPHAAGARAADRLRAHRAAVGIAMAVVALVIGVPLLGVRARARTSTPPTTARSSAAASSRRCCARRSASASGWSSRTRSPAWSARSCGSFILEPLIPLIDDWLVNDSILGAAATLGGAELATRSPGSGVAARPGPLGRGLRGRRPRRSSAAATWTKDPLRHRPMKGSSPVQTRPLGDANYPCPQVGGNGRARLFPARARRSRGGR